MNIFEIRADIEAGIELELAVVRDRKCALLDLSERACFTDEDQEISDALYDRACALDAEIDELILRHPDSSAYTFYGDR